MLHLALVTLLVGLGLLFPLLHFLFREFLVLTSKDTCLNEETERKPKYGESRMLSRFSGRWKIQVLDDFDSRADDVTGAVFFNAW